MDLICIEGLQVQTIIGIHPWERTTLQTVCLDVEMAHDNSRAAATDCIADTLDYHAVSQRLIAIIEQSQDQLIETLAERCAHAIQQEFGVSWVRLKLKKPAAIPTAIAAIVCIERGHR